MRLQGVRTFGMVRPMDSLWLPPCIALVLLVGCAGVGDPASDSLKSRLVERETKSLVRQASARIQAARLESETGFIEPPLPEPDLTRPVSELIPWKD